MTRLDVLSGIPTLKVAVGYEVNGVRKDSMPSNTWEYAEVKPVFEELPGWEGDLRKCRTWDDLPATSQTYLEYVAEQTKTPVAIVSIGPDRSETIFARRDLIWG